MSMIKGARNPEAAKKFYDWALTVEMQNKAKEVKSFQLRPTRTPRRPTVARPLDDQADRLRLQEVRLERGAQAAAAEVGHRGLDTAAISDARAQNIDRASSDRHPVDGGRIGGYALLPWYGLDSNFFTFPGCSTAIRSTTTLRRRCSSCCRARSSGWRRSAGSCSLRCCCGAARNRTRFSAVC